jgi:D-sedoheptulose 7-phosphate isomerase
MTSHVSTYFNLIQQASTNVAFEKIESLVDELVALRKRKGRLFLIGVGGSAANCSHACNDFRKLCNIEAYAATDNIAELTARINDHDDGWETVFTEWLDTSRLSKNDAIFVLSVGGGSLEPKVSVNIAKAVKFAKLRKARILGIVGRDGGVTKEIGHCVAHVTTDHEFLITPLTESMQAVIWHCLVSHPKLQKNPTRW